MLSSYILVLSTKRLRRDLNPCYSTVTEWCHNQLGDGAKTRWICLQFNIPNITHYLYCCIHLNGGRQDSNLRCFFVADLQSAALAAGLLPRIIIKLDSYPLEESVSSGALINLPQMVTIFTNHQRLQAALSFCLVTLSFSATRYLESTFLLQFIYRKDLCPSQINIACVLQAAVYFAF